MIRLYANKDFPLEGVIELRRMGYDVLTTLEAKRAGQRIPDDDQLAFAQTQARVILTLNRRHFIRLHMQHPGHSGIITCTADADTTALALRIDGAIRACETLQGQLIRITRPNKPSRQDG